MKKLGFERQVNLANDSTSKNKGDCKNFGALLLFLQSSEKYTKIFHKRLCMLRVTTIIIC